MEITLLYFDDCPSWRTAEGHLAALAAERPDVRVTRHVVDTAEEAERTGFLGSPSIHLDGVDVFAEPGSAVGLTCRRYPTPDGPRGSPTLDQLRTVFAATGTTATGAPDGR